MIRVEYYHRVGLNRGQIRFEDAQGSFPFDGSTFWSLESSLAQTVHRDSRKEVPRCLQEPECERVCVCVCVCVPLPTVSGVDAQSQESWGRVEMEAQSGRGPAQGRVQWVWWGNWPSRATCSWEIETQRCGR